MKGVAININFRISKWFELLGVEIDHVWGVVFLIHGLRIPQLLVNQFHWKLLLGFTFRVARRFLSSLLQPKVHVLSRFIIIKIPTLNDFWIRWLLLTFECAIEKCPLTLVLENIHVELLLAIIHLTKPFLQSQNRAHLNSLWQIFSIGRKKCGDCVINLKWTWLVGITNRLNGLSVDTLVNDFDVEDPFGLCRAVLVRRWDVNY